MPQTDSFRAVLAAADKLCDQHAVDAAILDIAGRVDADFADLPRPLFLTVMNGGLFFAARLGLLLHGDFEFDYVHATRYRGTEGGSLKWIKRPDATLTGRQVLIVDDILDEGYTLAAIRQWCLEQGASAVRIAVLVDKPHARRRPGIAADYVGVVLPDRYLFGYGMDWHGHGRNLPAIYALSEQA